MESTNRDVPKPVLIVGACAVFIVALAFVAAAKRNKTIPYSRASWDMGKGKMTTDNPRLQMLDEVRTKISYGHMSKKQVEAMLGPAEEPIAVSSASGAATPGFGPMGNWGYLVGLRTKSIVEPRRLVFLVVSFDKTGRTEYAIDDDLAYPAGSKIVPAGPYLPKPPPTSAHVPKSTTGPKKPAVSKGP